jgi:signal transduction histidine kinase
MQQTGIRAARNALGIVLVFLAYFATARLGLLMDAVAGYATLVWPPSGIALAALFLFGTRLWPGVLAAALCVNLVIGAPLPMALGIAIGNTLEALVGTWLLRHVGHFDPRIEHLDDVGILVLFGAFCSTAVSAGIGLLSLRLGGRVTAELSWPAFRAWWLGDMLGDLVVAPLLFVWFSRPGLAARRLQVPEGIGLFFVLLAFGLLVFGRQWGDSGLLRLPYLIFPPLLWAAVRFAQYGAVTSTFIISALAITGTAMNFGPFVQGTLAESLLHLQIFLGVAAATSLTVAAAIAERTRAVDVRDEFLTIASHELRTPLTALLLHIQTELRNLRRTGSDEHKEAIQRLQTTQRMTLRLGNLIGELLEVSRIIWDRLQPEREDVDLAALVQESLARQEQQLQTARCSVHLEVEGSVRGHWDRGRLDRVLDNLIGNAAKYGAGKPIEVRLRGGKEHVRLEVRDHGIGIEPADQARVFERFERAVSRRQYGGFGLGLWISRKIVEAHGGSISLMSEPGAGSTFSVELPRFADART